MGIQAIFIVVVLGFSSTFSFASFDSKCFDFQKKKVANPLKDPKDPSLDWAKFETLSQTYGRTSDDLTWAAVQGKVNLPISEILDKLYNVTTVKGHSFSKLDTEEVKDKNYLKFYNVSLETKPALFLTIDWKEEWAYALTAGSKEKPKQVVISYQKVAGTKHLERLCGNIVLNSIKDGETQVYLYEDVKAPRRSVDDTLNGLMGTLETLKK